MAIKVTRIQDVFKNKVSDQLKKPTIFVDDRGLEYEDYDFEAIEASNEVLSSVYMAPMIKAKKDGRLNWFFANSHLQKINLADGSSVSVLKVRDSHIKQIGSHVKWCGPLSNMYDPYPFNIRETFRYAYKLQTLENTLSYIYDKLENQDFEKGSLPEDLFWYCPDLEEARSVFANNRINLITIPSGLFERNKKLKSVNGLFSKCWNLVNVPADLFKNNPDIQYARGIFRLCWHLDMEQLKGIFKNFDSTLVLDHAFEIEYAQIPPELKTIEGLEQFKKDYLPDDMDLNQVERILCVSVQ